VHFQGFTSLQINFKNKMKSIPIIAAFAVFVYLLHTAATKEKQPPLPEFYKTAELEAAATLSRDGIRLYDRVCVCQQNGKESPPLVCEIQPDGTLSMLTTLAQSDAILTTDMGKYDEMLKYIVREKERINKIQTQTYNEAKKEISSNEAAARLKRNYCKRNR
jgi:hypothetical protein